MVTSDGFGALGRMGAMEWSDDVLPGFERLTLPLEALPVAGESEEALVATLVRPAAQPGVRRAVLYVHGWSDYFFQPHLAEFWTGLGWDFFAIDLRRYGRSLRPGQFKGFATSMHDYREELDAAYDLIAADHDQILLIGHSTGGLITSLWADQTDRPLAGLLLNSPWLDLQGAAMIRTLGAPIINAVGGQWPTQAIPLTDNGFYRRSLHSSEEGEWDWDDDWKSAPDFQVRAGWLRAVIRGHAEVAAGLSIDCPILVLASTRSDFSRKWSDAVFASDIVLDVDQIAARSVKLGQLVTMQRIDGGVHDLVLSAAPVREKVFAAMERWVQAYVS